VDIETIRERVRAGRYLIKRHAIEHALKEGFDMQINLGPTSLLAGREIYLHVVCEYADKAYIEFVTAYIPDETEWEYPPYIRRKRRK